jgi:hypothetical protein
MAVFCEFISVIIRRDSIDKYYPGGWSNFAMFGGSGFMCCDGEIVNIGFMNPHDTHMYIKVLNRYFNFHTVSLIFLTSHTIVSRLVSRFDIP